MRGAGATLLRRLVRLWGQSRIRLPRHATRPEEIRPGDRLQIGSAVWTVRGRLRLDVERGGGWMFRLEAVGDVPGERDARLLVPSGGSPSPRGERIEERGMGSAERGMGSGTWLLVQEGREQRLPPECVVLFPAPREAAL